MSSIPFNMGEAAVTFFYIAAPLVFGFIHSKIKKPVCYKEIYLFYFLLIGVGVQGFLTGFGQMLFPDKVASILGWPASPYLLELGMANVSYGVLGVLSMWLSDGWKVATAVGYGIFLLITGIGHLVDLFQNGINPGNAGTFVISDLFIGASLIVLIFFKRKEKERDRV